MNSHLVLLQTSRMLKSVNQSALISTAKLGEAIGVSQQTASRYLTLLEKEGLIERTIGRKGQQISLTPEGISALESINQQLENFLEGKTRMSIKGVVSTGIGEGAYYVRMYSEKIEKELKYKPYYGTLNIRVGHIPTNLSALAFSTIPSFEKESRSFGEIKLINIRLHAGRKNIDCVIALPERTHHKNELEIIGRENLRKKLGLKDGSSVQIEIT
jgi:riboflavin kinase